jgi:hypothetical protein
VKVPDIRNELTTSAGVLLGHELGHALLELYDDQKVALGNNVQAIENRLRAASGQLGREYYAGTKVSSTIPIGTQRKIDQFFLQWIK